MNIAKSILRFIPSRHIGSIVFIVIFCLSLAYGAFASQIQPAAAAPVSQATPQAGSYAGSESCAKCHEDIHTEWMTTRHAQAFSAPIFQRDWGDVGKQVSCLECHTTGYDTATGGYSEAGVTCEACHGPFQPTHPQQPMPITPNADLCGTCHKSTTDEWRASVHGQQGVQCQACHDPHSQTPKAETITALCANCHKERGSSFTHGTHADAGLECSNCHMYTTPRTNDPIMGLVPTGHTFTVGSDACIGCHQETVHTRDEIIKLTGEVQELTTVDTASMEQKLAEQEQKINDLEASNASRLYIGLAQGAIVGLATGAAAAFVVSRGIRLVEDKEDE
jgi:predicted CXXCH cytochrome family protein